MGAEHTGGVARLLIARHGETDWNKQLRFQGHADPPLNETGRRQAAELAARLAREPIDAIWASPLQRARETAEIVAEPHGLAVELEPGLMEVDVGSWSGKTRAELEELYPDAFRRWVEVDGGWDPGWQDGETYEQMAERVRAAVERIAAQHADQTVLLVAHGGTVRALQSIALGLSFTDARRSGIRLRNCGLFEADLGAGRFARID
jgi:broad specificity phosphatase PhoE